MSPQDDNSKKDRSTWIQMAKYSQLAFIFPAATVAGWLIGVALDRWLHTKLIFTLLLGGIGFAVGIKEVLRRLSQSDS